MNYRLDKKLKNKRYKFIVVIIIALGFLIYFHAPITKALSKASQTIFRPVFVLGNNLGHSFKDFSSYFYSKKSLMIENEGLKDQLDQQQASISNYNGILDENNQMKDILGRKSVTSNFILSAILSKPNRSAYDTFLIDVGTAKNIVVGDTVFALGNIPIGRVDTVYSNTAKVVLFSNPGESTQVVIPGQNTFMQIVGRGGGNFEMVLPRDFTVEQGTEVDLPGITPYVIGTVATIISDPRDAFTKALLVSPVNVQQLKFVEVGK
jgi:rod shape-determining protein MreC